MSIFKTGAATFFIAGNVWGAVGNWDGMFVFLTLFIVAYILEK